MREGGFDFRRSTNVVLDSFDAQAAFPFEFLLLAELKCRIDEDQRHDVCEFRFFSIYLEVGDAFGIVRDIDDS